RQNAPAQQARGVLGRQDETRANTRVPHPLRLTSFLLRRPPAACGTFVSHVRRGKDQRSSVEPLLSIRGVHTAMATGPTLTAPRRKTRSRRTRIVGEPASWVTWWSSDLTETPDNTGPVEPPVNPRSCPTSSRPIRIVPARSSPPRGRRRL